jgi:hypothetical protein
LGYPLSHTINYVESAIMGFLRKLFGGDNASEHVDRGGIYFHSRCQKCGAVVRNRIDKTNDLSREGNNYVWHKTIMDNRCFQPMSTVVQFDRDYHVVEAQVEGGEMITEAEYEAAINPPPPEPKAPDPEEPDGDGK